MLWAIHDGTPQRHVEPPGSQGHHQQQHHEHGQQGSEHEPRPAGRREAQGLGRAEALILRGVQGRHAALIPYPLVWAHEAAEVPNAHPRFREFEKLGDLVPWFDGL